MLLFLQNELTSGKLLTYNFLLCVVTHDHLHHQNLLVDAKLWQKQAHPS